MLRQVTQPTPIAGPLAQIFQTHGLSPRTDFTMFRLDKIVSALLSGPAPHTKDKWPSRRHLYDSVNKITVLPCTGT